MNEQKNNRNNGQDQADQVVEALSPTAVAILCALALNGLPMSPDGLAYRLGLEHGRIAGSLLWLRHRGIVKDDLGFWSIQTPAWPLTLASEVTA